MGRSDRGEAGKRAEQPRPARAKRYFESRKVAPSESYVRIPPYCGGPASASRESKDGVQTVGKGSGLTE